MRRILILSLPALLAVSLVGPAPAAAAPAKSSASSSSSSTAKKRARAASAASLRRARAARARRTRIVKRRVARPGTYQVVLKVRGRSRTQRVDVYVGKVARRGLTVVRRQTRTVRLDVRVRGRSASARTVRARVVGRSARPVVRMAVRRGKKRKTTTTTTTAPTTTTTAPASTTTTPPAPTATAPATSSPTPPTTSIGSVAPAPVPSTLVWSDEFDGGAGAAVSSGKWMHEVGGHGWGNNELQAFTNRTANAATDGQGALSLVARKERYTGSDGYTRDYTSARIITNGRFTPTYGRIEARIKPPAGRGLWPLFWMMGDDVWQVGWPESGEVDIMEMLGQDPSWNHGTTHGPVGTDGSKYSIGKTFVNDGRLTDDFHVFGLRWWDGGMEWYVDGVVYHRMLKADLPPGGRWVFDKPFHLILSMAVGGNWPGAPDATTPFPATMSVDWVRVYQ